jgi:hypothetical protein
VRVNSADIKIIFSPLKAADINGWVEMQIHPGADDGDRNRGIR